MYLALMNSHCKASALGFTQQIELSVCLRERLKQLVSKSNGIREWHGSEADVDHTQTGEELLSWQIAITQGHGEKSSLQSLLGMGKKVKSRWLNIDCFESFFHMNKHSQGFSIIHVWGPSRSPFTSPSAALTRPSQNYQGDDCLHGSHSEKKNGLSKSVFIYLFVYSTGAVRAEDQQGALRSKFELMAGKQFG